MKTIVTIILIIIFTKIDLIACKCNGPFSVEKEFDYAEAIFLGTVIENEIISLAETINPDSLIVARELADKRATTFLDGPMVLKSTFLVRKYFKGEIRLDTITIYTANQSSACGYRFKLNKSYVVYTYTYSNIYTFINIQGDRIKGFTKKKYPFGGLPLF